MLDTIKKDIMNSINNLDQFDYKKAEKKARSIWKTQLENYTYIDNKRFSGMETGKMIAYIDLDYKKISFGLLSSIKHNKHNLIDRIILKSIKHKTYWKIDPKKYHIFQSKSVIISTLRSLLEELNYKVEKN
jgi:hypothetical protein